MSTDTFETPRLTDTGDWRRAGHEEETATTERGQVAGRPARVRDRTPGTVGLAGIAGTVRLRMAGIPPRASRIWARLRERCLVAGSAAASCADGLRRRADTSRWCSLNVAIVIVWSVAVAMVAIAVALAVSPLLGIMLALAEGVGLGLGSGRLARLVAR